MLYRSEVSLNFSKLARVTRCLVGHGTFRGFEVSLERHDEVHGLDHLRREGRHIHGGCRGRGRAYGGQRDSR